MPTIAYRYLLTSFVNTLLFALLSLCLLFVIVDLMENLDDFMDQNAGIEIAAKYYLYFLPEIIKLMTPIAVLLATLFSMGKFSTNNEITAMKSGGISLYQIMIPFVLISLAISLGHLYFNGWVVPEAASKKIDIERKYLNKGSASGRLVNIYFRDTPLKNVHMSYYDSELKTGNNVSIETYSDEVTPRLLVRLEAPRIKWIDSSRTWIAESAIIRDYSGESIKLTRLDSSEVDLLISHHEIEKLKKSVKEMTYDELKDYIELIKLGGKDVRQETIEYYGNYAFPFANLIVVLFGVPFASVRKKGGIAIQISAALVVSFLYIIFSKVSQTIGFYIDISPILVGWIANLLFLLGSVVVLFKTRT